MWKREFVIPAVLVLFLLGLGAYRKAHADEAAEPANLIEVREAFFEGLRQRGDDPAKCHLDAIDKTPDGLLVLEAACKNKPHTCIFVLHPTEPAVMLVGCEVRERAIEAKP